MRSDKLFQKNMKAERPVIRTTEFALGAGVAVVFTIFLWLLSSSIGLAYSREDLLDLLPSILTIMIALISLFVSYHALTEQKKTRQAGTDPVILAHLGARDDAPIMITLEISNVGAGAAKNVKLGFDQEQISKLLRDGKIISDLTKLQHPIKVIPQDTKITYNLHTGPTLFEEPRLPEIFIDIYYEDVDGGMYQSKQSIDVSELSARSAHKPPLPKLADEVEKLRKAIEKLTSSNHKFHAITQDIEAAREEQQREYEELRALVASKQKIAVESSTHAEE